MLWKKQFLAIGLKQQIRIHNWMHKNADQLYEDVKDLITKDEFEKKIKDGKKEYDDLLDENTLALLIVDELGRNKQNISKIAALEPGMECTVFGKVASIRESRSFKRKNGSLGRVVNLELADETGSCGLALWDKDVDLVKNKIIQEGTNLRIINSYIKDGFNGLEINVGRWSLLEVEPGDMPNFDGKVSSISKEIKGKLVGLEPTRAFFKDNGEFGFVTNIEIENEAGIKQLAIWGEKVKEIQRFRQGDLIVIKNFDLRQKNGTDEIHVNGKGIIKKL